MSHFLKLVSLNLSVSPVAPLQRVFVQNYSKPANILRKLINRNGGKRSVWRDFDAPNGAAIFPQPSTINKGPQSTKRAAVLNKLFMKHITDLMATGANSGEISGLGIEVTKVKVGSEYNVVNVYWTYNGGHDEAEVSCVLGRTAGELRHELTSLRVIGKVPKIQFVRDRSVASWAAIEAILKTADMGEDYVPRGVACLKSDFGNEKRPEPSLKIESDVDDNADNSDDVPPMRQNVFGLDREGILERVMASMKGKRKVALKREGVSVPTYQPFDQEAFAQFLLKRKIMRDKEAKLIREEPRYLESETGDDELEVGFADDDDDYLEEEEVER